MRKIKFRAWHKGLIYNVNTIGIAKDTINKGMCFAHKEFQCEKIKEVIDDDDCVMFNETTEFMQFTGLHDKNGVEVYDKDVLNKKTTFDNNMSDRRFQLSTQLNVGFKNGCFIDKNTDVTLSDKMMTLSSYPKKTWTEYEIIGNELENPELL